MRHHRPGSKIADMLIFNFRTYTFEWPTRYHASFTYYFVNR